ncbi:hypothetical protein QCA50_015044 [Cerrena zonata]|uniref:Uncharacterized protein n=1 Tax=Cerrena zonata TaxID=2478898 RepID=A0AAW0FNH9_9APHY
MALFESSIFPEGTSASSAVWNQETRFGFQGVFGESQHVAPRDLCERIRTSFRSDELIEQLLSNISSSAVCGHGRDVISYTFQIIRIHHEIPITLDFSFLPERSWLTVSRLFMDALKDEWMKRTEDMEEGFKWDRLVLDAIYASLSTVQYPARTNCLEVIASCYRLDPEMLSNSLMAHFSRSTSAPWTIAIPTILRLLANSDVEQGDPWSIKLNLSTRTFHQLDLLANIAAKSLTALQASIRDDDPDTLKWVKWAVHILLSCVDVSDSFSGSTLSAIAKLTELNAHFIVRALPRNRQGRQHQVERLWKTILLMGHSRQAFIMQLWPKAWSPSDSIIPYRLTQMYATERKWTTTDAFLHTPPGFRAHHDIGNFIVCHLDHSRTLDYASRLKRVDELQSFLKSNIAWHAVHQIAAFLIQIGDPGWPEWMRGFIIKELTNLRGTSELSDNLKKCLYYNATEFITLLASHDIEHLDRLPQNLLVHRKLVDHPLTSMFYTFLQHPEPLSSETGESCLMRLLVNAEIDKPAWTFSSCDGYSPPRYACVSLALRILQYHLDSKVVQIPQKDIRFPLDLSQLKKEVWDDVSAAAAEVLNKDKLHDTDEGYFGGQKTFNIARMDAIMILLADSPHPFDNDLSYQVLEQETFFRWEDNLSVQSSTRHKLEKRRQSRIDERRRQGQYRLSVGTGTHDEASSLWQVMVTKSSQQIEEVYSQVKNDGDIQEDEMMCGSNCIHRDGLGGEWDGTEVISKSLGGRTSVDEGTYT